ncbi:MAG: 50S ribosomal protein L10 [Desulfovibrionaceae bacterium]|jgi:large subunit ribosomal protein L10|nr:50S ribosomal protein L10 [Desulfovibrionaceae bacterium]
MDKAGKAVIIERLKADVDGASIAVVTDFTGLKVEEMTDLRVKLRDGGVHYHVVKNTLARIAFTDGKHDAIKDRFKECCAVALGADDPVVVAKTLVDYAKSNKKFAIRFGSLDGKPLSMEDIESLAKLPGRQELLAKALGTMNAVPTNFVGLFANILRNFLYALNAIKDQKEAA